MASVTNTGNITYKNTGTFSTSRTMNWQIILTEGDIDYVNNQSRVYYTLQVKMAANAGVGWAAANSNWVAMGFDTDATYDDEYNCRYNSSGTLNNTNWADGYYLNNNKNRKMIIRCNATTYQPLQYVNSGATLENYTQYYATDGTAANLSYRTFTHAADGSGSAKFGVIWARTNNINSDLGLVGQFAKNTIASDTLTLTNTRAVVKIYNGSAWVNAIPFVYNGSAWQTVIPYVYNGSSWVQCKG